VTPCAQRRATAEDLDTVVALDAECFAVPWPASSWAAELGRAFCTVTLASEDGGPVGLSCDWCVAGQGHLLRLATRPAARGRGIARGLLAAVVARARAAQCREILLEVGARNESALGLYASAGFEEVGRRKGYYRDPPDDAVVMRLRLD
jgi:ribosomal-protein-alanine acetyltransferase